MDTILAHTGGVDAATGALCVAWQPATTFARDEAYELPGSFIYRRYGSPTVELAESAIRDLEGGADALLFGAGLSAAAAILDTLGVGDRLLAPRVMYHGAQELMRHVCSHRKVELTLFDAEDPEALGSALSGGPATMVWLEPLLNPTWGVMDIAAAARAAGEAGATLVVDATVTPPVTTRPIALGADFVMHSATKYLNGHSDVLGGALVARAPGPRWEEVKRIRKMTGGVMSPFDAWLLVRGLKTLALRFDRSSDTALAIARHFEAHPAIERVLYPGLETHPGHDVARRQMARGFGGLLSLLIRGGAEEALGVVKRLRVFRRATSLGGLESLAEHRASVEGPHSVVPKNLIRLSIGIEDRSDLIDDLESALEPLRTSG